MMTKSRSPGPIHRERPAWPEKTLIGLALAFAVLCGAALAIFGGAVAIGVCGLALGIALLQVPRVMVWVIMVGGLGVVGLVELYLPQFQVIRWGVAILSMCVGVISAVAWLAEKQKSRNAVTGSAALVATLLLFVCAALLATAAGGSPLGSSIVGLKNYFQMWGLMLALAWLGYKPADATRLITFLGLLAVVQLPFVLHQFLVLVPQRSGVADGERGIVAVDIVAGTFGGDMGGGGRTSDLAVLVAFAILLFFAQWKQGVRQPRSALWCVALAFAPILFNEAKLALVLIPLGLFLLFRDTLVRRPLAWLMGAGGLTLCMALVVVAYSFLPGAESQKSKSVADFITSSIEYNAGDQGYGFAILNRSTVYPFWWAEHEKTGDVLHALLGHGPGFSNSTAIDRGDVAQASRYAGYDIGLTGLSSLLWDTGLLGTGAFVVMLIMAYRLGGHLRKKWAGTAHEPVVMTTQIGIVMMAFSLLHNDFVTFDIGFQTLLAMMLGYLFAMSSASTGETF
jgi:hypothetical protein